MICEEWLPLSIFPRNSLEYGQKFIPATSQNTMCPNSEIFRLVRVFIASKFIVAVRFH